MSERRITINRADYYELNTLQERVAREEIRFRQLVAPWVRRSDEILSRLSIEHGFDRTQPIRTEDEGCVLILPVGNGDGSPETG